MNPSLVAALTKIAARIEAASEIIEGAIVEAGHTLYRADGLVVQLRNQRGRLARLALEVERRLESGE